MFEGVINRLARDMMENRRKDAEKCIKYLAPHESEMTKVELEVFNIHRRNFYNLNHDAYGGYNARAAYWEGRCIAKGEDIND